LEDIHLFGVFFFCHIIISFFSSGSFKEILEKNELQIIYDLELVNADILFLHSSLCRKRGVA
jgi:hypothetical protein